MQTTDLLEAAELAVRAYFDGSDRSKLNLRECMTDLRCAVHAELKRRSSEITTKIEKPK